MDHICSTCKFNSGFTTPPSPGGSKDGVDCINSKMAEHLDTLANDYPEGDYEQEYKTYGHINLWRVEVVNPEGDAHCECWELGEVKCPQCGDPLLIKASHDYDIYWSEEQEKWLRDQTGVVEYRCGNCRTEFDAKTIDDILVQVDEL